MINVRVEFHLKCPCCGTELVVDLPGESIDCQVCPWCGCACEADQTKDNDLKAYDAKAEEDSEKN